MGRFLAEVAENAPEITRQEYLDGWRDAVDGDLWDTIHAPQANTFFDEFAGGLGEAVDPSLVELDREHLEAALDPVKFFVDKRLAHHNPAHDPSLTYEEISNGVDMVGGLYRKYVRLIRRVELPVDPPADNTDWGAAFEVAWCPDGLPRSRS